MMDRLLRTVGGARGRCRLRASMDGTSFKMVRFRVVRGEQYALVDRVEVFGAFGMVRRRGHSKSRLLEEEYSRESSVKFRAYDFLAVWKYLRCARMLKVLPGFELGVVGQKGSSWTLLTP
jgi:hypothetical protein